MYYKHEIQIENDFYPDVFKALDRIGLSGEVGYHLMKLLEPIHFKGTKNIDYNGRYVDLRKSIENIFRDMVSRRFLPSLILNKGKKDSVNLSWSSLYLAGKEPSIKELTDAEKDSKLKSDLNNNLVAPILPKQLSDWLKGAIFQAGAAVHTSTVEGDQVMNLDNYLSKVDGSPYMLRSLTMGLCDFILWYDNLLKK